MIFQPWKNTELLAIGPATPLATRQNVRGMAGFRIWNITPWWWDLLGEGEPSRPQGLVPPWSFVEGELESADMLELLIQSATDLLGLPSTTNYTGWRFMVQFLDEPLTAKVTSVFEQPSSTALTNVRVQDGVTSNLLGLASAGNLTARSSVNAALTALPGQWTATNSAAVGAASSASRAAGGAGISHVCNAVSFGFSATTALGAITTVTINLRDGATGAGAVLWSWQFTLPAAVIPSFALSIPGLEFIGTAATAMTLEFAAAIGNLLTFANLSGFDAS